jgi:S-adenosylmethionine decarboxylase proenzyme
MYKLYLSVITFFSFCCVEVFSEEQKYDFIGSHFLASYYGCSPEILNDPSSLKALFEQGIDGSGATLLKMADFQFDPQGVTLVALLSESHASIHTYPEERACFVDFFTCGTSCDHTKFHQVLEKGLQATHCSQQFIHRN